MEPLVWEVHKTYGWASMRSAPWLSDLAFDVCCIYQVENGLWRGIYIACPNERDYTIFPGEYPLEELQAILETTVALLEEQ